MKKPRPFHPVLFALFPILALYASNADEVGLSEAFLPLAVSAVVAIALLVLFGRLLHDRTRAGLVTSAIMILFFSYGHVWELVNARAIGSVIVDRDLYLLVPWLVVGTGVLLVAFGAQRYLSETTTILNAVAVFLVLSTTVSIVRAADPPQRGAGCPPPLSTQSAVITSKPRDIYYLIFDRYGGSETLRRTYDFDNSEFLSSLEKRGFYVANDSRANYPRTAHSLASSLNADYLSCLGRRISADNGNWAAIFDTLSHHEVGRFLQRSGYKYLHLGSWWDETAESPIADRNYAYTGPLDFGRLVYSSTLARPFGEFLGFSDSERESDYKRTLFQLRKLKEVHAIPGPKFVFAHLLIPHDPYVFDVSGRYQTYVQEQRRGRVGAYLEQLAFTNRSIQELLDMLLSGPPESQPIIVLQSDEGPHPIRYDIEERRFDWTTAATEEINQTLRILNAYYLPGVRDPGLYQRITPVNTFRKIFDLYLGTHFGALPDEVYVYADDDHPYRFERVTDRVWGP